MRRRSVALGGALFAVAGMCVAATTAHPGPAVPPGLSPERGFEVQSLVDGFWQPAGELAFGVHYTEGVLALPDAALAGPLARVRLVPRGGGAAHVDHVSLGGAAPVRVDGASEPEALALALHADRDVLDASGKAIELTFRSPGAGGLLLLTARVEGEVVVGSPFAFPPANQFQGLTADSAFYRYRPAPGGRAPSWPETLDAAEALFAERCTPTTGHPEGVTFGWVANDRHHLYAAVEFTPDNTRDGDADWASVHVATGGEVLEFRVSERETTWGRATFAPTARASYRHKLYQFAIPFSELGVRDASEAGELKLAFSAYGTAAVSWLQPNSWDFGLTETGTTAPSASFTISNSTGVNMVLGTPWFTRGNPAASPFPVSPGTCGDGVVVPAAGSCSFTAAFAPTAPGNASDVLTFFAAFGTAPEESAPLFLSGTGFSTSIPTLGWLGLAALGLVLAGAGLWVLRRA